MRITSVGEHAYRLTRWAALYPINCYLVREDDGLTLIDTMIPGSAGSILAAAARLGAPIKRIVLTHGHGDHAGSLDALHAHIPDAEVVLSAREVRMLAGDRGLGADEAPQRVRGGYARVQTKPTRIITADDYVGSLRVYATPGHSPDHIAFMDQRDQTVYTGDALASWGGLAVAGVFRPTFPFFKWGTWDLATAIRSAIALRDTHPARLAFGHGAVLNAPDVPLARAIAEASVQLVGSQKAAERLAIDAIMGAMTRDRETPIS
jgi:glyoxylase-like metal-dependent hydrolase (beta-lactamase superfamily II)